MIEAEKAEDKPIIGWGAVVIPAKRIRKDIEIRARDREAAMKIDGTLRMAMAAPSSRREGSFSRIGIISAALTEYVLMEAPERTISGAAWLLGRELGKPYWWVEAEKMEGGTSTSAFPLDASDPKTAAEELEKQPTVRMMMTAAMFADAIETLMKSRKS